MLALTQAVDGLQALHPDAAFGGQSTGRALGHGPVPGLGEQRWLVAFGAGH